LLDGRIPSGLVWEADWKSISPMSWFLCLLKKVAI
jgi:hypothetical protein